MVARLSRPPTDLDSFLGRKWLEQLERNASTAISGIEGVSFITVSASSLTTSERVLTGSGNIELTDGGAGSSLGLDLSLTGVTAGSYASADLTIDAYGRITAAASGGGNNWYLTGNAGTVAGTNFLGTTDNVPFEIRVNNYDGLKIQSGTTADSLSVVLGSQNSITASTDSNAISGGWQNTITTSSYAAIGGGTVNTITTGHYSAIASGRSNILTGNSHSFIGGGYDNDILGTSPNHYYNGVMCGFSNKVDSATFSIVGGGNNNYVQLEGYSAIFCGNVNLIDQAGYSFIGNGSGNTISNAAPATSHSAIVAGASNTISESTYSAIVVGNNCDIASASYATILGGGNFKIGDSSVGYQPLTGGLQVDVSAFTDIAFWGDVDTWIANSDGTARKLKLFEPNTDKDFSSAHYSSLEAQTQAANLEYTLPSTAGAVGDTLTISTASAPDYTLAWSSPSANISRIFFMALL